MSFYNLKKELKESFPKMNIRCDRPDYIEMSILNIDLPNQDVKDLFLSFCRRNGLPEINASQLSPSVENERFHLGCMFVCEDDHNGCYATCVYVMDKNEKRKKVKSENS